MTNAVLEWYIPFLVILFVVRKEEDVLTVVRVVCWCAIFVSLMGVIEFIEQKRSFHRVDARLSGQFAGCDNPAFEAMVTHNPLRNGMWRASSVYTVPLSLGEFEAMVAPLAYFFLAFGR